MITCDYRGIKIKRIFCIDQLYYKKILMDISKILIILVSSILIYLSFLFLGFNLRNKNIKAQNISKKDK